MPAHHPHRQLVRLLAGREENEMTERRVAMLTTTESETALSPRPHPSSGLKISGVVQKNVTNQGAGSF